MTTESARPSWIAGPKADLGFFSLGWIPLYAAFAYVHAQDPKGFAVKLLIGFVLMVNFIHRNFTHVLVYGNKTEFQERKWSYVFLPIFFVGLTAASVWYQNGTKGTAGALKPYLFLLIATTLWNFYHTIMQKAGFLRIYSRKAGYGSAFLDKAMVISWFITLCLGVANSENILGEIARLASSGRVLVSATSSLGSFLPALAILSLIVSGAITLAYLKQEVSQGRNASIPKNLFLGSTILLYASVFHDFLAGFVAIGFSHALEYVAFVDVFARKKYASADPGSSFLARNYEKTRAVMPIAGMALIALFLPWRLLSPVTLGWFYVGTSFLHYLYVGWIWKVRRPKVGAPLGLAYERAS